MKKLFVLIATFSMLLTTGCNYSKTVTNSLDKDDAGMPVPLDIDFTKVISHSEYSKAITFTAIAESIQSVKMSIDAYGGNTKMDSVAIITKDKYGERIGGCKTKISYTYAASFAPGQQGTSLTYVRGDKSYTTTSIKIVLGNDKYTNFSGSYHMDIPSTDERGVGTFFGINGADPNESGFISPFTLIEKLNESGLVSDGSTQLKYAHGDGISYYKVIFQSDMLGLANLIDNEIVIGIKQKHIYGIRAVTTTQIGDTKMTLRVRMAQFKGKYDVPTSFGSEYDKTIEEYNRDLQNAIMNALK